MTSNTTDPRSSSGTRASVDGEDLATTKGDTRSGDLMAAALRYALDGWPVIPLHTVIEGACSCHQGAECGSPGKHPRTRNGAKDATKDLRQIIKWWQQYPAANIGIATGAVSRLVVVDIDPRNGGDGSFDLLLDQHGSFPETVESLTGGGGRHLLFAYPDNEIRLPGKLADGIDLKSDGGYIVAPPSLHASGDRYAWELSSHPGSTLVAPLPEWIKPATLSVSSASPPAAGVDERLDPAAILTGVAEGERNSTVYRYCCRLRGKNLTREEAAALVDRIVDNTTQFPPFTMTEATKCLDSAWQHTPEEAKTLATNADEKAPTLAVRAVRDVLLDPPSPVEPLVQDLILPGDRVVIGGARGAAKTWLGMGTSLMLSRGNGHLFDRFPVDRPMRVLYCHGELLSDETTHRRWVKLAGSQAVPDTLLETFSRWTIRPVRRRNRIAEGTEEWTEARIDRHLSDAIETHQPEVLVLDPWRMFFAGEENSNTEVQAALARLDELADKYGLTLVLVHHFSQYRSGTDPEDWWRGASRLGDWASVRITLEPYYTPKQWKAQGMTRQEARRYATLRLLLRRQPTPDEFDIRFDPDTGFWVPWKSPQADASDRRKSDLDLSQVTSKLLSSGGEWSSTSGAAEALGVAQSTAKAILETAERTGKIERFSGPRNAIGWRLATPDPDPMPKSAGDPNDQQ